MTWYFTFGVDHPFKYKVVPIRGNYMAARNMMVNIYGLNWCSQYDELEFRIIEDTRQRMGYKPYILFDEIGGRVMYKCDKCKSIFPEPNYTELPEGEFGFCPFCDEDSYHRIVPCLNCEEWIEDDGEHFCDKCKEKIGDTALLKFKEALLANFTRTELTYAEEIIGDNYESAYRLACKELEGRD